jgi:hypothetical protein
MVRWCAKWPFHNFVTNGTKVIEFRLIFIIGNYIKIINMVFSMQSMPLHLIGTWIHICFFNITRKPICLFISWGNTWRVSNWLSYLSFLHLVISTNQCLLMSHEEMHLPLHVMGKCMGYLPLTILLVILAFSHLNQSCHFMSHEECICFFMSWKNTWEISHWPSHWPSSHLTISINQCLFMSNVCAISSHQEHETLYFYSHLISITKKRSPSRGKSQYCSTRVASTHVYQ